MKTATVLLLLLAGALPAEAYTYIARCRGDNSTFEGATQTYVPATISFPAGSNLRSALEAATSAWNFETPGTRFRFSLSYQNTGSFTRSDGKNDIALTAAVEGAAWNAGVLAATLPRYDPCNLFRDGSLAEADIVFNNGIFWDFSAHPPAEGITGFCGVNFFQPCNFALVAIHEMGHSFGLNHEDARMATMNSFYPHSGVLGNDNDVHPHADDILGNRAGYSTGATERDLAASAFERTGSGTSQQITATATAFRGHPTPFRFSISNRGTVNETSVPVSFYLSTDRVITTGDRFLGSGTFNLSSGFEGTFTANATVPVSTPPGSYFFGVIMDPAGTILEKDEGNNAVALVTATDVPTQSPPVACFSANTSFGTAPLNVSVDASCSHDPVGTIVSYSWDFGNGHLEGGSTAATTYFDAGSYTITLTVQDDTGLTSSTVRFVSVAGDCGGRICDPQ